MVLNRENSEVLVGDHWFFYWNTSASLWESILRDHSSSEDVWIPLNWGLHFIGEGQFDFGQERPELDVVRLINLCRQLGKTPIVFMPIGPNPIFTLGGLTPHLARTEVLDSRSMARVTLSADGKINRIASQYDVQVFQSYRKFLWNFIQVLSDKKVSVICRGLLSFSFEDDHFLSWWEDTSNAFDQAYDRYLKKQNDADRTHYQNLIIDLYIEACKELLGDFWEGVTPLYYVGTSQQEFLERVSGWSSSSELFKNIQRSLEHSVLPSLVMLAKSEISEEKIYFFEKWLDHFYKSDLIKSHETQENLLPLVLIEIFEGTHFQLCSFQEAKNLGLYPFLCREYPGLFRGNQISHLDPFEEVGLEPRLKCFLSQKISSDEFQKILKLFMMGHYLLIDKSSLSVEDVRRWEVFILENKLKKEVINFVSMIEVVSLSEGKMILFDGNLLKKQETTKQLSFWKSLFNTMKWRLLKVEKNDEVVAFWKTSDQSQGDFNYSEKRRLTLVNPFEKDQVVQIPVDKRFAFLKMIDPIMAQLRSTPLGIEVTLGPRGLISLDYGSYEE
jgi:hypothetical protein